MRLLLDTHALLWMFDDSPRLPRRVAEALGDPANVKLRFDPSFMEQAAAGKL